MEARSSPLLQVSDVSLRFGGVTALDNVSFAVHENQICGLIGPNGAGKSSLFNCISRLYRPTAGDVIFRDRRLSKLASNEIVALGIGRTFQNVALFKSMTVAQNIKVGAYFGSKNGFLANALGLRAVYKDEARLTRSSAEFADFVGLSALLDECVGHLPFAVQKRVEFARALASGPKLLLLDEPAAGLNHEELGSLAKLILRTRDELGTTVLLVEHHMGLVMKLCDKLVALNFGRKIAEGTPAHVQTDKEVLTAYLGTRRSCATRS